MRSSSVDTEAHAYLLLIAVACFQYTRSAVQFYAVGVDNEAYAAVKALHYLSVAVSAVQRLKLKLKGFTRARCCARRINAEVSSERLVAIQRYILVGLNQEGVVIKAVFAREAEVIAALNGTGSLPVVGTMPVFRVAVGIGPSCGCKINLALACRLQCNACIQHCDSMLSCATSQLNGYYDFALCQVLVITQYKAPFLQSAGAVVGYRHGLRAAFCQHHAFLRLYLEGNGSAAAHWRARIVEEVRY